MIRRVVPLVLSLAATTSAQHVDLTGRIIGPDASPIGGALIRFAPLALPPPPIQGVRGNYELAQRWQLANARLPRTVTDRDGEWRITLSPVQAALTTSGLSRFLMTASAPSFAAWQRCFDGDLRQATRTPAQLAAKPTEPPLRLQLDGGIPPYRGCVVIERAFRIARNRAIWISDLATIAPDGTCTFDQTVRIPGEPHATSATAREEAYRITVNAAGYEAVRRMVPTGTTRIALEPSSWGKRRVLAARAQPAARPIRATYRIGDEEVVIEFDEAEVALLGDIEPIRVATASGDAEIDTWDADVPLFITEAAAPRGDRSEAAAGAPPAGTLDLEVVDGTGAPVFGAGVWLENRAVKRAATTSEVFGVTDSNGRARLERLPLGTFSVLVVHPDLGYAELLADIRARDSVRAVTLRPLPDRTVAATAREGSLLLDLGPGNDTDHETETSVGIFQGSDVTWHKFPNRPRFVRLEGLAAGPTNCWIRVGADDPRFVCGVLAGTLGDPALEALAVEPHTFVLQVTDGDGAELTGIHLSLGDRGLSEKLPKTAELFEVQPAADGPARVTVRARGPLWARAHVAGHAPADILLDPNDAATPIGLKLERLPPPAEAETDKQPPETDK